LTGGECARPRVWLINEPGRLQSAIFAALTTTSRNSATAEPLIVANTILAGSFTSRLNMNLRESKGWSYGAQSILFNARGPGLWLVYTSVQPGKTAAAMSEIEREMRRLAAWPVTDQELSHATTYLTRRIPAEFETNAQVAAGIEDELAYGLPQAYYRDLPARLRRLCPGEIADACRAVIGERSLSWVVVGDAATIATGIELEAFGSLKVIDHPILGR
jgi:zinc protease